MIADLRMLVAAIALALCSVAALAEKIPLQQRGGTYLIPVRINDTVTLDFLLDTGASEVTIPADVFLTLIRTHTVSQSDFLGEGKYILADGSEQTSKRFRLHELRVGNHALSDVVANVAPVQSAYPLLGQTFLSQLSAWSIDNRQGVLVLSDESISRSVVATPSNALEVVRAFYQSLSQAHGVHASALVIPEKRASGPFSAADLSRFYGNLTEPLRLSDLKLSAPNVAQRNTHMFCRLDADASGNRSFILLTEARKR